MLVGDQVEWLSRVGLFTETKRGWIVAVVPANASPFEHVPPGFALAGTAGMPKPETSYLIAVGSSEKERARGKYNRNLYWQPETKVRIKGADQHV